MSSLLIQCEPLQILPSLAKAIGLNEAIFLQQLHYWLQRSKHDHDGRVWVYNTYEEWRAQFPFWSLDTMQRIARKLVKSGLLTVHQFNKQNWDRRNWYSIDYEKLEALELGKAAFPDSRKLRPSITAERGSLEDRKLRLSYKDQEITQETTTETRARERPKGYKQTSKQPEPKTQLPPEDFQITPDLEVWLAEMQIEFQPVYLHGITLEWRLSCEAEDAKRYRTLAGWQAKWKKYVYWTWKNRNGRAGKGGQQQAEYTGPVKSKPNPVAENCPDCRGMGNVRFEVAGVWYAKPCKHERSGVAAA